MDNNLIKKITEKKEFSKFPTKDVLIAFENFNKEQYIDEEKVKLTRNLLRNAFSAFTSQKLLSLKDRNEEWFLKKHLSTRERFLYYEDLYKKLLKNSKNNLTIIDLGAGVNGFSYKHFKKLGLNVKYVAIESVGQLVDLTNKYFKENKINGRSIHLSLFELEKVKEIIKKQKKPKIVFLFKVIDSLEVLERNYSKKLISEIVSLTDEIVISFATRSMVKRKRFKVKRNWIVNFIKENFKILNDFEIGDERYIIFKNNS